MATLLPPGRIKYEEWLQMAETHRREEVVDGFMRVLPPNKSLHARVISRLVASLHAQLDLSRVEVFCSSFGLVIRKEPLTCREPDLAVFEKTLEIEVDGYFRSAPQLTIEVLSPTDNRRLQEQKLRDYESIGTPEVWLISPEAGTVEILLLENGKLHRSAILAEGVLSPKHFPSVAIDISEIWPD